MADKTGISWTDARTVIVDRDGRRIRFYCRLDQSRPGQQERRRKASEGLKWCRGCKAWLDNISVCSGVCRECANAEERARYASHEALREYRKTQRDMRKRKISRIPVDAAAMLMELFDNECAYCDAPATGWDHVLPVSRGGQTEPGNMVPACATCNSKKKDATPNTWLARAHRTKAFTIEYLSQMGAI